MTVANTVNKNDTPILFLTLVPLSEVLLPNILNNENKNNTPLTINNILLSLVNSKEKLIFLKKCEYESMRISYLPNIKLIPRSKAFIIRNPTIGIMNNLIPLNLKIMNDNSTHIIRNVDG